jgi:diguanylate cyclase (GGDEF)-like protein
MWSNSVQWHVPLRDFMFMTPPVLDPSHWSRGAQHAVLARGPLVCTAWLTAMACLVALVITHAALSLVGGGDRVLASIGALLCAVLITPLIAWPLLRLLCELEDARAQLDVLATRDELTGVYNRRQFLVLADREWARCRRYDMSAALLMIDVDLFKQVNDVHGHLAGDLLLREIARAAGDTLRQPDLFGRFGGEEFAVFLPHADPLGALDAAERIRGRVAQLSLEWKGRTVHTTVSVGVAALEVSHDSLAALIHDADQALYAAKDAGRNCVRSVPPPAQHRGETSPVVLR